MDARRFKDLYAFKNGNGQMLAFHAGNLEVAELDEEAWAAMLDSNLEAAEELRTWADELPTETSDQTLSSVPSYLSINISQICNLKCSYCAAGGDGTYGSDKYKVDVSLATQQIQNMMKRLPEGQSFGINFLGGEPLLYPQAIREIADFAKLMAAGRNPLVFSITTNGTLITPEVAELLASINAQVVVSIDGPPEVNSKFRPAKRKDMDSTEMTVKGLNELAKVRDRLLGICINSVVGLHSLTLVETYKFVSQWDPKSINFIFAADKEDAPASKEFLEQFKELAKFAYERGGESELLKINPLGAYLRRIKNQERIFNACGVGKTLIQMDTKGELYGCNWFMTDKEERMGRVGALDQSKMDEYKDSLIDLNDCNSCWARHLCGGGCMHNNMVKNGDKHRSDLEYCDRVRSLASLAIEYFYKTQNGVA